MTAAHMAGELLYPFTPLSILSKLSNLFPAKAEFGLVKAPLIGQLTP